eukprot:Amastigsp_a678363_103.p3 type:complete len:124 gc:universal Amastigsp_a678363_103:855-1226(+)
MPPPYEGHVLRRTAENAASKLLLTNATLYTPPEVSDPIASPAPTWKMLSDTRMSCEGRANATPSQPSPALMEMWSSPDEISEFRITTNEHESGSIPSVFGVPTGLLTVTPSTSTPVQAYGCNA